jgi:hypothetical protein
VRDERIGMVDSESDVEQNFTGRDTSRPAACAENVLPHLLVARATKSLLFGPFSDHATDVGGAVRPGGEAIDLVDEPQWEPRREEPHGTNRADETVTRQSRLRAETVS